SRFEHVTGTGAAAILSARKCGNCQQAGHNKRSCKQQPSLEKQARATVTLSVPSASYSRALSDETQAVLAQIHGENRSKKLRKRKRSLEEIYRGDSDNDRNSDEKEGSDEEDDEEQTEDEKEEDDNEEEVIGDPSEDELYEEELRRMKA